MVAQAAQREPSVLKPPRSARVLVGALQGGVLATQRRAPLHYLPRRRSIAGTRVAYLLMFAGLVAVGGLVSVRKAPDASPPPPQAPSRSAGQPQAAQTHSLTRPKSSEPVPSTRSTEPTPRRADTSGVAAGVYVFGRDGQLRIDARGRTIVRFETSVRCLGRLVLRDVAIALDGRFVVLRSVGGRWHGTVRLAGASIGPHTLRGTVDASRSGCDSGRVAFTARLS